MNATAIKPKRPLSGYNLFYRYKRIKVLEATAHPNNRNDDDDNNSTIIHVVLTATPGLEDKHSNSRADDTLPSASMDELRVANIRATMEGKLFPNENARNRLHRKVHGIGFVEMGKTMRDMWGNIDKVTKEVFCELADVGRVRYRNLMEEYKTKLESEQQLSSFPINIPVATTIKLKPAATPLSPAHQEMRTGISFERQVSTEFDFQASTRHQVQNFDHSDSLKPFSITTMANPAASETSSRSSDGRRVSVKSAELDLDMDSFEPLSVATKMDPIANNDASTTLECGSRNSKKGEVSAQDFMDFIGELDEAITMHELQSLGNKGTTFDTEQNSVPMPAAFELKNSRARMA